METTINLFPARHRSRESLAYHGRRLDAAASPPLPAGILAFPPARSMPTSARTPYRGCGGWVSQGYAGGEQQKRTLLE